MNEIVFQPSRTGQFQRGQRAGARMQGAIWCMVGLMTVLLFGVSSTAAPWTDRNKNGRMDPYEDPAAPIEARVADLLAQMTLEEKIGQLQQPDQYSLMRNRKMFDRELVKQVVGRDGAGSFLRVPSDYTPAGHARVITSIQEIAEGGRLGVPVLFGDNAPYGYADLAGSTVFPGGIGLASTWRPDLAEASARVTAYECATAGVYWNFAPVVDIGREPRWGRIGETFGEDTYLASVMAYRQILGYQGEASAQPMHIAATPKHFVANGIPLRGLNHTGADISDRTLREVYLPPFRAAVAAGAATIMAAHNEFDGIPSHANRYLLTKVLRDELRFGGLVVSDYTDIERVYSVFNLTPDMAHAGRLALEAGMDVDMSGSWAGDPAFGQGFTALAKSGEIEPRFIDRAAGNMLRLKFRLGLFDRSLAMDPAVVEQRLRASQSVNRTLARELARESLVLLRNTGGLLPLVPEKLGTIAVIGPNADHRAALFPMKYNNTATPVPTVLQALQEKLAGRVKVTYARGCPVVGHPSAEEFKVALDIASGADVIVLVVGETSVTPTTLQEEPDERATVGEGVDRSSLSLPGAQQQLVEQVCSLGKPVVVVMLNGRPLAVSWIAEHVPALLEAWGPGEEGAEAIAAALLGEYHPGGKLPVTMPRDVGQVPNYYNTHRWRDEARAKYVEAQATPLFAFGHGLSYTSFHYDDLKVDEAQGNAEDIRVEFSIRNSGARSGSEVVQVYLRDTLSSVARPVMELKAFRRVQLEPEQKVKLTVTIPAELLALINDEGRYVIEPGRFDIMIGSSSQDIRLRGSVVLGGRVREVPFARHYESKIVADSVDK